jgi:hypothetical protein
MWFTTVMSAGGGESEGGGLLVLPSGLLELFLAIPPHAIVEIVAAMTITVNTIFIFDISHFSSFDDVQQLSRCTAKPASELGFLA